MFEKGYLKNLLTGKFGYPEGLFLRVRVSKWLPDCLLAKTMHIKEIAKHKQVNII